MKNNRGAVVSTRVSFSLLAAGTVAASLVGFDASAGMFQIGGEMQADYRLTLNYGVAMRTRSASQQLINGPINNTGLPITINSDDGDRNFNRWSLINNRLSGLLETQLSYEHDYGLVASGDGFYDQVYHHPNDNNSPSTVNKTGPANQFTAGARYYDGERFRLLDAYAYGTWTLGDQMRLDLRVGKQMVAWGESLFFGGIASSQTPADATKGFAPGVEVKEILLPVPQVATSLTLNDELTLQGYYRLDYKATELFPMGDFFSVGDVVGPGSSFSYGAVNPLAALLKGVPLIQVPPLLNLPQDPVQRPSRWGQYGISLRDQITGDTNVSLYWLRYDDTNPAVNYNTGYFTLISLNGSPILTTQAANEPGPVSYYIHYYDGIDMAAMSFSTLVGTVNVAGEISYRDGQDTSVQATEDGDVIPVPSRAGMSQALLSGIYAVNPNLVFDNLQLVGEVGYLHVNRVDAIQPRPGITPVGNGDDLLYSKNAWAFQTLMTPGRNNVLPGWNLTLPMTFGWLVRGNPSMSGAFGVLYGQGDMRASIGAAMQYLDNLQIGVSYSVFFGDPGQNIGASILKQNPYADRDYMTVNIKYVF